MREAALHRNEILPTRQPLLAAQGGNQWHCTTAINAGCASGPARFTSYNTTIGQIRWDACVADYQTTLSSRGKWPDFRERNDRIRARQ